MLRGVGRDTGSDVRQLIRTRAAERVLWIVPAWLGSIRQHQALSVADGVRLWIVTRELLSREDSYVMSRITEFEPELIVVEGGCSGLEPWARRIGAYVRTCAEREAALEASVIARYAGTARATR